jgi:Ca2+-binding EF-hand superfamily protein
VKTSTLGKIEERDPTDTDEMREVWQLIFDKTNQQRIHLKPTFQDFDRTNNGRITKAQFMRVLDRLGIKDMDANRLDAIANLFAESSDSVH